MHRSVSSAFRLWCFSGRNNGADARAACVLSFVSGLFQQQQRSFNLPSRTAAPSSSLFSVQEMASKREYDDVHYWDKRYADEGDDTFDWYQRYKELEPFLDRYIKKDSRILMAGCGNAVLSEEMVVNGYNKEIMNIDFSSVVIKLMESKHRHVPQLKCISYPWYSPGKARHETRFIAANISSSSSYVFPDMTLDARNMDVFGDNSFDAVIDKGLLDSLLCGSSGFLDAAFVLEEICRVLKPGAVFLLVTYGEPLLRMHHLQNPAFDWKIVLHITSKPGTKATIPEAYSGAIPMDNNWECDYLCGLSDPDLNFVYVCTKISSS